MTSATDDNNSALGFLALWWPHSVRVMAPASTLLLLPALDSPWIVVIHLILSLPPSFPGSKRPHPEVRIYAKRSHNTGGVGVDNELYMIIYLEAPKIVS
ncbi:hypothetical protein TrVFT333_004642 [Trichoderma virens FT-333]|nr:hypothetical protein TrVFT333_004642 [Trichoderma virens FT-333]